MKHPLASVLLIDDSEADNFIHVHRLRQSGICTEVVVRLDGQEAIDYLRDPALAAPPELIFLDINMPIMDGWEFLKAYGQLPPDRRTGAVVTMLTDKSGGSDYYRAKEISWVKDYEEKPLTKDKIYALTTRLFPQCI